MTNECVICLNNIEKYTNTNIKCHFQQECSCFYNVHNKCLIEWIDKKKTCIHCYKQLSYNIIPTPNNTDPIIESNRLISLSHQPFITDESSKYNIFKCCNIL
jgi:hypothetical protein